MHGHLEYTYPLFRSTSSIYQLLVNFLYNSCGKYNNASLDWVTRILTANRQWWNHCFKGFPLELLFNILKCKNSLYSTGLRWHQRLLFKSHQSPYSYNCHGLYHNYGIAIWELWVILLSYTALKLYGIHITSTNQSSIYIVSRLCNQWTKILFLQSM